MKRQIKRIEWFSNVIIIFQLFFNLLLAFISLMWCGYLILFILAGLPFGLDDRVVQSRVLCLPVITKIATSTISPAKKYALNTGL
jgi:hypothetical protein